MPKYKPVVRATSGPYSGAALVGTYSVSIGWSFDDPKLRKGLHGFGVRRSAYDETGELISMRWLGGFKRFKETDDGRDGDVTSRTAPFQRFRWNEYTLHPGRSYKYEVFPMRGKPEALTRDEDPLVFRVVPSLEDQDDLGIYVNRGVTAAKAYFQRFGDRHPSEVEPVGIAYSWLSRGLKESLLAFIEDTTKTQTLHVAIYEFFDDEIAAAFKRAHDRGVTVRIVHDAKPGKHSTEKNEKAIHKHGLDAVTIPRTTVNISHNKLVVRLKGAKPLEAWTGSANFSENAFNYQTNTALVVRDPDMVQYYDRYIRNLFDNPSKKDSKLFNRALMDEANAGTKRWAEKTFFSPISQLDILEASCDLINEAKSAVLVSAPFGVDKSMIASLGGNPTDILEYGLANATAKKKIEKLRERNTRFFPPNKLETYDDERWDAKAFGAHKIHAKTIVTDPFGKNPKVLIGSANFSSASCKDNDENALLIEGDKRLAAILATEFMRMYDHYKSRFYIRLNADKNKELKKKGKPPRKIPIHLASDDSWSKTAFDPDSKSHKFRDRIVFSGQ